MRNSAVRGLTAAAAVAGVLTALTLSQPATAAPAAEPMQLKHTAQQLEAAKQSLDRTQPPADSITSWYVDPVANTVVVEALPDAGPALETFLEESGVAQELVQVAHVSSRPQLLQPWPLREGDPYYVGAARCTVGFLVQTSSGANGFVTAGHCGNVGAATQGFNLEPQGNFQLSVFPGADWALVLVNDNWIPTPRATGSQEAAIGASVCKIGSTTGTTCGTLTARNVTVNYPQGTVTGLSQTNICAEPGDSGGPVFAGTQGQGIVSGGSGNCSSGGVTYFQPLNPVLASGGLTLLTA